MEMLALDKEISNSLSIYRCHSSKLSMYIALHKEIITFGQREEDRSSQCRDVSTHKDNTK